MGEESLYGDYMCRLHDGQGTILFPSATIGRGVHSMVIACVPGSKLRGLDDLLQTKSL